MDEVREAIRSAVAQVENGGPAQAEAAVERVRSALRARGLARDCHVGGVGLTPAQTVEWYAGQFVAIVEDRQWFAMNSFINCLDRFAPEEER